MAQELKQAARLQLRESAKERYRDKKNIEAKWLDQYGNVSKEGDYQRNRGCLSEVFNMLDVVMENCIDDFRHSHAITSIEPIGNDGRQAIYHFEGDDGKNISFRTPSVFASRATALRAIGYDIPNDLYYDTRILRNETTHGNQTVVLQHVSLSYEDTMKAMLSMANTLINLGQLSAELREPSFDLLRVREGDTLLSGVYTVGPLAGEGGMSRVYRATQERINREFAIKELKPGTYSEELIQQECSVLSSLHHDHIPQIYDFFYENATYYIVMNYIDGVSLEKLVEDEIQAADDDGGSIPAFDRLSISHDILDVLSYLHSPDVNLVFADLSPDNIMIDSSRAAHLIDFGITAKMDTKQAVKAATPGYSAPEAFAGEALDGRADIYSFGYILRYIYTGLSPLEKAETPTGELIDDTLICDVINRCTAKNPDERYASVEEIRKLLFPSYESAGKKHSVKKFVAAGIIAAAAVAGAGIYFANSQKPATETASESTVSQAPVLSFEASGLEDHAMEWNDIALEAKMREITGITEGDINLSDIWHLTSLSLSDAGISDISALSELTNLTSLQLNGNYLTDISPLSALTDLSYLSLSENRIEDISPLSDLNNLASLFLDSNSIEDASALSGLSALKELDLSNNGLSDISFLSGLTSLTALDLNTNEITDISVIASLTALSELDLKVNKVTDISVLSDMTQLTKLWVGNNQINGEGLDVIANIDKLKSLDCSFCNITDASFVEDLSWLEELYLGNNDITDLSPLSDLSALTLLEIQNNPIGEDDAPLKKLSGLKKLTYFELDGCGLTDLTGLEELTHLFYLDISNNPIEDYSILEELQIENVIR